VRPPAQQTVEQVAPCDICRLASKCAAELLMCREFTAWAKDQRRVGGRDQIMAAVRAKTPKPSRALHRQFCREPGKMTAALRRRLGASRRESARQGGLHVG